MLKKKIAIFGGGPTGMRLVEQIIKKFGNKVEITLYEKQNDLGDVGKLTITKMDILQNIHPYNN